MSEIVASREQFPPVHESAADEFGPVQEVIELPVPGPRGPLRIRIEAASLEELIPMIQSLPGSGRDEREEMRAAGSNGDDPLQATLESIVRYREKVRPIIERWVIAPRIVFDGPRTGAIEWMYLNPRNQAAIVTAIARLSNTGSAKEAERLATFPSVERGGVGDGVGDRGPLSVVTRTTHAFPPVATADAGGGAGV